MMDVRRVFCGVGGLVMSATIASAQPQIAVNGTLPPNAISTSAGSVATVVVSNGPGNTTDWIALYPIGAADTAYLDWKYLSGSTAPPSSGLTNATIQELLPVTPGDYEIRLFGSNGYQLLATSSTISVSASITAITINGVAPPAVATASAGATLSLGVTNDPGNATDWIALYPAGTADSAFIDWRYLNGSAVPPASGTTSATLAFPAPITAGNFEFRLFANNGYERLATNAFIVQASTAQLTVNGVTAPSVVNAGAGTEAVVDVAGGPGNPTDWVGLFAVGSTNGQYIAWQYLTGTTSPPATGLTAASLRFLLPTTPGNYEFRLFANNTNQVLATSPTVAIAASTAQIAVNGVAPPDPVTAPAGSIATASVSGGPANATDWVGFYPAGSADGAFLDWRYLNGTTQPPATGSATGVVSFTVPVTAGDYEIRLFASNTYARLATSAMIAVPAPTAQIAVNGTLPPDTVSVISGSNLSVAVTGAPGNPTDWIALAPVGSASGTYVAWQYLNGLLTPPTEGLQAATVNFVAPTTAGSYELRLFTNNTYQRLATSTLVTVASACTYSITPTSLTSGAAASTGTIDVTTTSTCEWTATSDQSWISVTPSSSTGPGPVTYTIAANQSGARSATLTIAGQSANVTQGAFVTPITNVVLTTPFPGTTFNAPSSLAVAATVTSNVPVESVAFYAGSVLLGSSTAAPYQTTWLSPSAGNYTIIAVATDDGGHATTSPPVNITVNATGTDQGTLGTPIASPSPGVFAANQLVTLQAADGTTIHYTTNGLTPTLGSATYTGPITLTGTTTIRAAAFQTGWTTSSTLVASYTIDSTPPTITATKTPVANAAGWNNTPVTVTFSCSDDLAGVSTCPQPFLFSNDGAGQSTTVTSTDLVGNQRTLTVTANIDRSHPYVAIATPANNATVNTSTIAVSATVTDSLSGIASISCNGVATTVINNTINCTVAAQNGLNILIVQAMDAAGNNSSASVRIMRDGTPTRLSILPTTRTVTVGNTLTLHVHDDFGPRPSGLSWSTNNSAVATISADGVLTAVGTGQATITANSGPISAEATINVLSAGPLPIGTTKWAVDALTGFDRRGSVAMIGPDAATVVQIEQFWDESIGGYSSTVLRGFAPDGELRTSMNVGLAPGETVFQTIGAVNGGILMLVYKQAINGSGYPTALVRVGASPEDPSWRYSFGNAFNLGLFASGLAQAPDGTIFGVTPVRDIVAIDGSTGQMRFQVSLPKGIYHERFDTCPQLNRDLIVDSGAFGVRIDASGVANVTVGRSDTTQNWTGSTCAYPNFYVSAGNVPSYFDVSLYRITSVGDYDVVPLHQYGSPTTGLDPLPNRFADNTNTLPDDDGGVLAYWTACHPGPPVSCELRGKYVKGATVGDEYVVPGIPTSPGYGPPPPTISGVGQIGYTGGSPFGGASAGVSAFNVTNGAILWTTATAGQPVAVLDGGRIAVGAYGTSTKVLGPDGSITTSTQPGFFEWQNQTSGTVAVLPQLFAGDTWIGSPAPYYDRLSAIIATPALYEPAGFTTPFGGGGQRAGGPQRFTDSESAALSALNYIYPYSSSTGWEWGGLICQQGNLYLWSPLVTSHNQSSVNVLGQTSCAPFGSTVAHYHTHPPLESPNPSGNDILNANSHPTFTYYLRAPKPDGMFPPSARHALRYRTDFVAPCLSEACFGQPASAERHTFELVNGVWVQYVW